ncbi:MAG: ATP-binding protein [Defluviitaleaceae bacterium]|nr:ATP-binding protein [Defluviitaleaceae bacterium]
MTIKIENLGKIKIANIDIKGIAVIAGLNNTGKSTVSKTLFCVINNFYNTNKTIETIKKTMFHREIRRLNLRIIESNKSFYYFGYDTYSEALDAPNKIYSLFNKGSTLTKETLWEYIQSDAPKFESGTLEIGNENSLYTCVSELTKIYELSDVFLLSENLSTYLNHEFAQQINNIYLPDCIAKINFNTGKSDTEITINDNNVQNISTVIDTEKQAIYIDTPYVLDSIYPGYAEARFFTNKFSHRELLTDFLNNSKNPNVGETLFLKNRLDKVFQKLQEVIPGKILQQTNHFFYMEKKGSSEGIKLKNLSSGLKTFAMFKKLLDNGSLEEGGTLILDEPEVHLHPEWQLVFAEVIVLLQKELGMHILINTHSPYFLDALDVYSKKHNICEITKYYLAEEADNGVEIHNVTGNLEQIYKKMAAPLQKLDNGGE